MKSFFANYKDYYGSYGSFISEVDVANKLADLETLVSDAFSILSSKTKEVWGKITVSAAPHVETAMGAVSSKTKLLWEWVAQKKPSRPLQIFFAIRLPAPDLFLFLNFI